MLSLTNIKMNTVEKEKQETTSRDIPEKEPNLELDKLNEQIAELTNKNTELLVSIK